MREVFNAFSEDLSCYRISRYLLLALGMLASLLGEQQVCAKDYEVFQSQTAVYDAPGGKQVGTLSRGKRVKSDSEPVAGFVKLQTKSQRSLWIQTHDVREVSITPVDEDTETDEREEQWSHLTYDLGFSTGSTNGFNYNKAHLGLNWFLQRWFAWRNAVFARFIEPENVYGLDTSGRFFYGIPFGRSAGVTVFGGPGWRFITKGDSAPFAEAGLVTRLGGFQIGGGVKTFFNSVVRQGAPSDTQYFLILAGSGAL